MVASRSFRGSTDPDSLFRALRVKDARMGLMAEKTGDVGSGCRMRKQMRCALFGAMSHAVDTRSNGHIQWRTCMERQMPKRRAVAVVAAIVAMGEQRASHVEKER